MCCFTFLGGLYINLTAIIDQRPCELFPSHVINLHTYIFSSKTIEQSSNKFGLDGPFSKLYPTASPLHSRWWSLLKIVLSSIVYCCFIISKTEQICHIGQFSISSGFFCEIFFQPIFTNQTYYEKKITSKSQKLKLK